MLITSLTNPLIKKVVALRQKKYRDQSGLFVFESGKMFEEAVNWHVDLKQIFYTERWLHRAPGSQTAAFEKCLNNGIDCICVDEAVMKKLSAQNQPEGIVCTAGKLRRSNQQAASIIILEDVQDPGNVGTIIRTADAAGFELIITSPKTADIYNDKVLRASMGSIFRLNFIQSTDLIETVSTLKATGCCVIGSSLAGDQTPYQAQDHRQTALILGNESKGMSSEMMALCDKLLCIPMYGHAESLNVGIAAGILMYDIARQLNKKR